MCKKMDIKTIKGLKDAHEKDVLAYIENMSNKSSKKTLLSALVLITNSETYKELMTKYANEVNDQYRTGKISEDRQDAYITIEQVKDFYEKMEQKLKKSASPTNYVNYLISALMSGAKIPPRRLEWATVKVKNYDETTDNYLKKNIVYFNKYKTVGKHGAQQVEIPKDVMPYIKKWLKINESNYLLVNTNGKPFSSSTLSHRLGEIYENPKIGIDILRSIFVSDLYKDVDTDKLNRIASAMGHQRGTAELVYNKKR
jgi:integrase